MSNHTFVFVFADVYARQRPMCALLYDSTLGPSTNTRHYLSTHSDVVGDEDMDEGTTKLMLMVRTVMMILSGKAFDRGVGTNTRVTI